jgi:hypothetical protein
MRCLIELMKLVLLRRDGSVSTGDNDIDLESNELGSDLCEAFGACFRPAILDREIAPLYKIEYHKKLF